ncbi:MAG: Gfo/Idh/MocA family oxidoreductase [Candidatus Latescibacteria bacterium]|nr:Gfo/Idh/MocA family oxidoreductase [Candidatus Latescibacterota bacterium]
MKRGVHMKRRNFLQSAGIAAFAAPMIVPSSVFGRTAPSNRFTLGSIGMGNMGTTNTKGFLERDDVQVVAVCDLDRARLMDAKKLVEDTYAEKSGAGSFKGCDAIHDFRDLVGRDDIDLVTIAVPDHWHAIPAITAANAKKDIYAEKPLARTIHEGRAICDAVKRNGVVWQTGSWQRSRRQFRQACELVRNGKIGELKEVLVGLPTGKTIEPQPEMPVPDGFDYDFWLGPSPRAPYTKQRCHWNFRWIMDYSGGQLTDWAGHHCDIAQWGMDTERTGPVEIRGEGVYPREGLWDAVIEYRFECMYENGVKMTVANNQKIPMGAKFVGSEGWVYVNRQGIDAEPKSLLTSVTAPDGIHLYRSNDHYANFIDCVRSRKETIAPAEVAHRSISVGHLGDIAMQLRRTLKWDPAGERFVNDPEADRYLFRSFRSPWRLPV